MFKSALSAAKRSFEKLSIHEKNLSQAAEVYRAEKAKPEGTCLGLRKIAEMYGVNYNTLYWKVNNRGRTRQEYLQCRQKLSVIQERHLVELLVEMDQRSLGFDHDSSIDSAL